MRLRLHALAIACTSFTLGCFLADATFVLSKQRNTLPTQQLASTAKTQYTIDASVCPPTRPHLLHSTVSKACASLDKFLARKPIARHTQDAFDSILELIGSNPAPIVLDSGCGTGMSTELLGKLYPDHVVIGVDRSFSRLSKTKSLGVNSFVMDCEEKDDGCEEDAQSVEESKRPICEQLSTNTFLVRAELVDFWRCCQKQDDWTITHHYLLYPNPYPTHTRLTQRWYAHPSFPLILQLRSDSIIIRSNWEGYLKEFARSVEIAHEHYDKINSEKNPARPYLKSARQGPTQRTDLSVAWTYFERKYDLVGEPTYELELLAK